MGIFSWFRATPRDRVIELIKIGYLSRSQADILLQWSDNQSSNALRAEAIKVLEQIIGSNRSGVRLGRGSFEVKTRGDRKRISQSKSAKEIAEKLLEIIKSG